MSEQRRSHLFPRYHVALPRGFVNDPNGPVEIDGVVHLYFQSRALADLGVPVEWGHASSPDLVRWTLHRPALSPVPGGPDSDGAWSGNTVLASGILRAYYCGRREGRPFQSILLAESTDGGASFGEPRRVLDDPAPGEGVTMVRDPFVWREADGWHLATGSARTADGVEVAAIRHHVSDDGLTWTGRQELAAHPRTGAGRDDTGSGWECPQVVEVDGRRAALVSSWSEETGPIRALAFPVPIDGDLPRPQLFDEGQNFYAASAMRDSSHGTVVFGWVTEGRSEEAWREDGWAGAISLPRRLWWEGPRLASGPHPALDALRVGDARPADGAVIGAQVEVELPVGGGRLRIAFGDGEHFEIIALDGLVTVGRRHASRDPRADADSVTVADAGTEGVLRVFVDGSIVEVFTPSGRAITTRVYPESPPPWRVQAPPAARLWTVADGLI